MSLGMPLQRSNHASSSSGPAQLGPQGMLGPPGSAPCGPQCAGAAPTCPAPALHVQRTPRAFCWARLAPPSLPPPAPPGGHPIGCGLRPSDRSPAGPQQAGSPTLQWLSRIVDWPGPCQSGRLARVCSGGPRSVRDRAGGGFRFRGAGGRAGGRERRRRRLTDNEGGRAALSGGGGGEQRGARRRRGRAPAMDNQVRNSRAAPAQPAPPAGPPPSLPSSSLTRPPGPSPPRSRPLRSRSAPARPALCAPTAPPGLYVGQGHPPHPLTRRVTTPQTPPVNLGPWLPRALWNGPPATPVRPRSPWDTSCDPTTADPLGPSPPGPQPRLDYLGTPLATPDQPRASPPGTSLRTWLNHESPAIPGGPFGVL